jgi:hypothetical protein
MVSYDWLGSFFIPVFIAIMLAWCLSPNSPMCSIWCVAIAIIGYVVFRQSVLLLISKEGRELFRTQTPIDLTSVQTTSVPIHFAKPAIPKRLILIFKNNIATYHGDVELTTDKECGILFRISEQKHNSFLPNDGRNKTRPKVLVASYDGASRPIQSMELKFNLERNVNNLGLRHDFDNSDTVDIIVRG